MSICLETLSGSFLFVKYVPVYYNTQSIMKGSLSYQDLLRLQKEEFLKGFQEDSLQPASIDLSISDEAYRLRGSILPHHGEKVRDLLHVVARYPHDLSQPLEPGQIYLCKVSEQVRLPGELYGYTNPKSSTGRNDIQARLLADGVPRFDTIPRGFSGELWVLVTSRHFLLKLSPGDRLLQLRLFDTEARIGKDDLQDFYNTYQLLWTPDGEPISLQERKISDHDGTLILAVDLESEDIVGYRAKPAGMAPVLIFNKRGHSVEEFSTGPHKFSPNPPQTLPLASNSQIRHSHPRCESQAAAILLRQSFLSKTTKVLLSLIQKLVSSW